MIDHHPSGSPSTEFDIYETYQRILKNVELSPPLAAILSLTALIEKSRAGTMFELVKALNKGAETLKSRSSNPISLNAGCELFIAFVTLFPHESSSFSQLKRELVKQGETYVNQALTYRTKIAELALDFIKDDSIILTHSYSRVVMKTLLMAHERKRISVFVTEARPGGLGIKTAEALALAGIPCSVILDSAVAFVMDRVDFVLVGSEAVVESGGLINAVGSNQIAIIAKAANKPFYALAESYKFHRLFPLRGVPGHNPRILSFPSPAQWHLAPIPLGQVRDGLNEDSQKRITQEQIARDNPEVDYTRPDLISLVFSELGSLTPSGVSQYLVGMFAG